MARPGDRPRHPDLTYDPDYDRPDETAELDRRPGEPSPTDHLEVLRQALRVCSPVLYVRLITTDADVPYLHTARGRRDKHIIWDKQSCCFRWESSGESPGSRSDVDATARQVAKTMGAPVRTF